MVKRKNAVALSIIIVGILLIGLSYTFANGFLFSTTQSPRGEFIAVPSFGYLACQESSLIMQSPPPKDGIPSFERFSSKTITCNSVGSLIEECTVTFQLPSRDEVSGKDSFLGVKKCVEGLPCRDDRNFDELYFARKAYGIQETNYLQVITIDLKKGEYLFVQYLEGDFFNVLTGSNLVNKGRYFITYKPFFIYKYDTFSATSGGRVQGSDDCVTPAGIRDFNFIVENIYGGGKLSENMQVMELLDVNNLRAREARMPFISEFIAILPPQFDYIEGTDTYCYDKKIYRIEEIETTRHGVYRVANTGTNREIATVECCNDGDAFPGFFCENFKKVPLSESNQRSCSILNPCPLVGYVAIPGQKVASQECIGGRCVTNFMGVECSFDLDCPGGYCDVDYNNPENNKCTTREIIDRCGNGICEPTFGENAQTCPQDCDPTYRKETNYLLFILIGIVTALFVTIIILVRRKMKGSGGDIL